MFCRNKWTIFLAACLACMMAAGAACRAAGQKGGGNVKDAKDPRAAAPTPGKLKAYPSRYYVIYTDLGDDLAAEASARMTAMAEEYYLRTKDFGGVIRNRLPFYLFSRSEDYLAAGGTPGSAGQYGGGHGGGALMALAGKSPSLSLWHTVQHEGFHQFAHMVIGGHLPVWVNEGLAEYFALGIWTGDGFVTGTIPQGRLTAVRGHIKEDRIAPLADFLLMSGADWRDAFSRKEAEKDKSKGGGGKEGSSGADRVKINYDQAWSMVHFLVHAENGKYRASFAGFIADISAGMDWQVSFQRRFGGNVKAFEQKYRQWWLALPDNPTRDLFIKADAATLTSFLARAVSQGQSFADAEQFFRAAKAGQLKCNPAQKLPESLLNRALVSIRGWDRGWSIDNAARVPKLVLAWPDGTNFTGTFTVGGGMCANVKIAVTSPPPPAKGATTRPGAANAPGKLTAGK